LETGETPILHSLFKDAGKGASVPKIQFDAAEVKGAMESVSAKDVDDWSMQNIGESFFISLL
jgi:hypothetical protein